jgi:uncharacterized membrane protein
MGGMGMPGSVTTGGHVTSATGICPISNPPAKANNGSVIGPGYPRLVWSLAALIAASIHFATPAHADLKLCNSTESRVGVAIGYQDKEGWATEGWWNIASQTCETLLKGDVPSRFIYVHAVDYDRGGEWVGTNFMCTNDKSFAIRGVQECGDRGYKRTGFFEVDTGDAKEWTIRLTDPDEGTNKNDATQPTR